MAAEDDRKSNRSQNTLNTPGKNSNCDGIEDSCLKADYIMTDKNIP